MNSVESRSQTPAENRNHGIAVVLLMLLVTGVYFTRIDLLPVSGEEGRWARGAVQMMETGDWIVPRQQGIVFPERPPLGSWAMALGGFLRGEVDSVAIRLPSLIAILLTTMLIYFYASRYLSPVGAIASGAVYATFGQVMEIGRLGESEALFTLFVSSALLLWHHGYANWRPSSTWLTGYSLMALGALVKGLQAPIYFIAVVFLFLLLKRDWKYLVTKAHLAGIVFAVLIVGSWQLPFYLATDIDAVVAIWAGLAGDRLTLRGLLSHLASYPLETFACLLPWSPLLFAYLKRDFRQSIVTSREMVLFLFVAIVVTYPSVWFAAGAKGRYFMPLYPMIAILIGLVMQKCVTSAAGSADRKSWKQFEIGFAALMIVFGVGILYISGTTRETMTYFRQPIWLALAFVGFTGICVTCLIFSASRNEPRSACVGFSAICVFVGLSWAVIALNYQASRWHDIGVPVAAAKAKLPSDAQLVSFTPADHRFCYFYRDFIPQLGWPESLAEVPQDVEYFCFNFHPTDTPQRRSAGRGRDWKSSAGTLPFAWEEVARIDCDRKLRETPGNQVVIGRIIREPKDVVASKRSTDSHSR